MAQELKPLVVTDQDKEMAEKLKGEANLFFAENKFGDAIEKYTEAISYDPNNPVYYSNRSFANFKMELYGAAQEDATKAIELDQSFVKGYYRRASAFMAMGKLRESVADFKAVIKVAPTDPNARSKLTACQKELKRIEFEKAIFVDISPRSVVDQLGDIDAIEVEESYTGPHLSNEGITLEFIKEMLQHLKEQKKVHRKYVYKLLIQAKEYFESRPTIEDVSIPEGCKITVCGDIHGQFYDLLHVFEINGLPSEQNLYLWNGDFVDRGSFSVECILTLFAFKLLYPNSVYLSRGNHETDDMNKVYGFEGEVNAKYDNNCFRLFSVIFNAIPLGNLIQGKILVVHGGLFSRDDVSLQEIRDIDRFKQPGSSGLMCELLWSDPCPWPGRHPSKRGVGIQFGPDVTENFLRYNNLKLIIRSHEVKQEGYEIDHNGKCVTIFSAPNYCDINANQGAYIHITPDLELTYHKFHCVPHPAVPAMKYARLQSMF